MAQKFVFQLPHKFFIILCMLSVAISMACGLVAFKMVSFGSLTNTGQVFIFPLLFCFADVIAEVFGVLAARFVIYFQLVCSFIFVTLILLIIRLPSPSTWHLQEAYNQVLNPMFGLHVGVLVGTFCNSLINIHLLSKWKLLTKGKYFWLRSTGASCIGILVYTITAAPIAYRHIFNNLFDLLEFSLIRTISNVVLVTFYTIFSAMLVRYLKTRLNTDVYGVASFNPFKL